MKLANSECLFSLYKELDVRFPCVRSLSLIKEDKYGGWLKCIAVQVKKFVFEQYMVMNWKPVQFVKGVT